MKYQVTVSEFAALSEDEQKLYGSESDGKYTLKIEGMPDFAAQEQRITDMDAKLAQLLSETKVAKKAKKEAETAAAEAAHARAEKDGDVEVLNKSWQTKFDTAVDAANTERDDAMAMLRQEKVHSRAVELATTMAVPGSADVLLPHIESRLAMEIKDGRAVAVVLDMAGKPSALTVDELGKEIANNAAFAPLIVASYAAGGGAKGTNSGGAAKQKTATRAEFDGWDQSQRSKFSVEGGTLTD